MKYSPKKTFSIAGLALFAAVAGSAVFSMLILTPLFMANDGAFMKKLVENIPSQYYGAIETVVDSIVKGAGQLYLTGFVRNLHASLRGAVEGWKSADDEMKGEFVESFKGIRKVVPESIKEAAAYGEAPAEAPAREAVPAE